MSAVEPVPAAVATDRGGAGAVRHEHDRGHITDSRFFGDMYATEASRRLFCDVCRMQRWLDVEAALAASQAAVGLIPARAAERIRAAARVERLDLARVREETAGTGHSLAPLLAALERRCEGDAGRFVHHGATTQDIQDTAQSLEMQAVLLELEATLNPMVRRFSELAELHRETVMVGRTHGQPALATTFGLKVAGWLDEILRHVDRIAQARPRTLVAELGGGVGTMAAFGGKGPALLERFAALLGLGVPAVAWHASRDRVAEVVLLLAMVAGTLGRIGDEVRSLCRPEIGELEVRWSDGQIASTTMPHKRNFGHCEQVVALARLAAAHASSAVHATLVEHERDGRSLRMEWVMLADVSHHTLAAAALLAKIVDDCEVRTDVMAANARAAGDALVTEAVMFALARHVGKPRAYALVYAISQRARSDGASLREALLASGALDGRIAPSELDALFDPRAHVGSAGELVDRVLARAGRHAARPNAGARRNGASPGPTRNA